jgi:hypothetical protein
LPLVFLATKQTQKKKTTTWLPWSFCKKQGKTNDGTSCCHLICNKTSRKKDDGIIVIIFFLTKLAKKRNNNCHYFFPNRKKKKRQW